MARRKSPEERLADLEAKEQQIKARADKERQRLKQAERKADTRRKIAIGGAVIAYARSDKDIAYFLERLIANMSERDRKAFADWTPPAPATADQQPADKDADSASQ